MVDWYLVEYKVKYYKKGFRAMSSHKITAVSINYVQANSAELAEQCIR